MGVAQRIEGCIFAQGYCVCISLLQAVGNLCENAIDMHQSTKIDGDADV